ncbi:MAG: DUF6677 family protein [Pirellulaceae bacterium]
MSLKYRAGHGDEAVELDLRDPRIAAFLAWLWPGAGHFYQRRYMKGFLFMICIVSTFLYGLLLGRGRVVYASFRPNDFRWQFICQSGFGMPSLLALAQSAKVKNDRDPFFVIAERFPAGFVDANNQMREFEIIPEDERGSFQEPPIRDGFMAPPKGPVFKDRNDVLGMWHAEMRYFFDLGTLFTIVAGLLNVLVIYDAFAGPAIHSALDEEEGSG